MKQRLLKAITSMMLIVTLTMANFLFLGVNFVSYAAEAIDTNKSTNHKNVEFMAYFKDENGNKVTEKKAATNLDDLELYLQVSVNREGYFNGKVILNNSNFKLKTDVVSESVSKIENNIIYLNQINAGESKEIVVKIEILKDNQFDLNLLDCESEISIEGIYKDSTEKDISINAIRGVSLVLVSPYTVAEGNILMSQDIITNKIFEIDGQNKRVIQIMINSGIKDNLFPISQTIINVQAPKISDTYPETVLVNSNEVLVTNGEYLTKDNWNYDNNTGIIEINIENTEKDGKVSWIKNGTDNIVITYIFDENIEINSDISIINSEIRLYDINKTVLKMYSEKTINSSEKDSIVTSEIVQNETSIYKGKLYAGISRDITYKNLIDVNLNKVIDELNVEEAKQTLGNQYVKSVYKTTKISKSDIDNILGETGTLEIINLSDGNTISTINKNTEADENGNVIITYPENVETIKFKITSPASVGRLEVETTKTINATNKETVKQASNIVSKSSVIYLTDNVETKLETTESTINLNETETTVDLQISRTQLSAMTSNDNVEFRIILNSREEKHELFKNPVLKLELPEKVENIKINSVNLLYEDEMKITSAVLNNKTIEITLNGEQTKYKEEAVDGAIILINANLQTSQRIPSSTEQVKVSYTNNTLTGSVTKDIEIVSYAGVITTNQVSEYGIEVINNEGKETAELSLSDDAKNATIIKKIINNKENKITNVRILGTFPTENATDSNNIGIEVGNISATGVDASRVKIYYSNNENATQDLNDVNNAWVENIEDNKNVKKYLVVVNELDLLEEIDISYQITIPSNLEYNKVAQEGYIVYYNNMTIEEKIETKFVKLATPAGTIVEATLKALVAGQESNTVKENGILRYEINVANTGSEDVSNVVVKGIVPNGTTYVNSQNLNNEVEIEDLVFADESKKDVEFVIEKLNSGEQLVKYYEVQVNENMAESNINNIVTTKYGEVTKNSNEVATSVEESDIEMKLISVDAKDSVVKSGYQYRYVLHITNKSNKDMKNVKATINTGDIVNVSEMYYIDSNDKAVMLEGTNSIEISKIAQGETIEVAINTTVSIFTDTTSKDVTVTAVANYDESDYYSNQINLTAKSDLLFTLNVTSENSGSFVKAGDVIKYNVTIKNDGESSVNVLTLNNWISNDVTLTKIIKDGVELSAEDYSLNIDSSRNQKVLKLLNNQLEPGKTTEYQIEVVVNLLYGNTEAIEIVSEYSLEVEANQIATARIMHVLQPEENSYEEDTNNGGNNSNNGSNNNNPNVDGTTPDVGEDTEYKLIYGVAWIDENENGQKDMTEKAFEGIQVKLLDATTNKFVKDSEGNIVTATTTGTGFYNFSKVVKGQYIVIFEYDTTQYGLTTFEKEGVSNEVNSNVITKTIEVDGEQKQIAATEVINVNNDNIANINIGLVPAKKYDLQLDKYVSKVTIQNDETETYTYTDSTIVKQEIDAKQVNATTIVVEYTIKVTNKGDVTAYVKKIADYLPADYKFNSELNKDWYQSGNDVYSTSLSNEAIEPGTSREIKLTVIKQITENNTGLINNTAEIVSSYNELGLTDVNSTEGNKIKGENDMGSADLIISIRTGQVVMTISLIISSIVILGIAIVLLKRIIINRRLF